MSITQVYARTDPNFAQVRIVRRPDARLRVELQVSGVAQMGAATGADCYAVAEGELKGRYLRAAIVPFAGPNVDFTASDLAQKPRELTVQFRGDEIDVAGSFDWCPLHTTLTGRYYRIDFAECRFTDRPCWSDR